MSFAGETKPKVGKAWLSPIDTQRFNPEFALSWFSLTFYFKYFTNGLGAEHKDRNSWKVICRFSKIPIF
jgi:hypothetical protein